MELIIQKYTRPIRKVTRIEDLIKEQNYKGVNEEKLKEIVMKINIEQDVEVLIEQL